MQSKKMKVAIEWIGSISGVSAALLIALNIPVSKWAFLLYLLSSICLFSWGIWQKAFGVAFQNLVFIAINLLGIYRWLIIN